MTIERIINGVRVVLCCPTELETIVDVSHFVAANPPQPPPWLVPTEEGPVKGLGFFVVSTLEIPKPREMFVMKFEK